MSRGSPKSPSSCCHNGPLGIDIAYSTYLAADRVSSEVVYIYDQGSFYVSTDGSHSFSVFSKIPGFNEENHIIVLPMPGISGRVLVSTDFNGLWRTDNMGKTFTQIEQVQRAMLISFGKEPEGSSLLSLYLMGRISNMDGIFVSYDLGLTWTNIQDINIPIGDNPWSMCSDRSEFGRLFIGTLGRGIYYSSPVN